MKMIHLHGKAFDEHDFRGLVIGGQNLADTIRFVVPKIYADEVDLSSWLWVVHYENKEGSGDDVNLAATPSPKSPDLLYLDWCPSQTATQVSGKLEVQLYAIKQEGETQHRFVTAPFPIYVSKWLDPTPITQALPTVIEQALAIMAEYLEDVEKAIELGEAAATEAEKAEAARDLAEKWAAFLGGPVEDNLYSALYYATAAGDAKTAAESAKAAAEAARDLARKWAALMGSPVEGDLYSSKYYASQAGLSEEKAETAKTDSEAARDLARKWATQMGNAVEGDLYSSKYYASQAKSSADNAATSESNAADSESHVDEAAAQIDAINTYLTGLKQDIDEVVTSWELTVDADKSAWYEQVQNDNAALDAKILAANTTIDGKIDEVEELAAQVAEDKSEIDATMTEIEETIEDAQALVDSIILGTSSYEAL